MKRYFIPVLLMLASCVFAQQPQPASQPSATADIATKPPADGKPIATVLAEWAKQHEKTVVVEPRLTALIKLDPSAKSFEQGLDLALKPHKEIIWRKLYLREKMEQPKPERLTAMVRTMVSLESIDIIVQDPKASKISSFVKSVDVPKGFEAGLGKMAPPFGAKCIYVVIDKRPAWSCVDGLNLLDLIADPSLINENTLNESNTKEINRLLCEAIVTMDPENQGNAYRGMMGLQEMLDTRTRVTWWINAANLYPKMTDEEEAAINRSKRNDRMRDEGIAIAREMGLDPNVISPVPGINY